ncbi:hypothetical protein [Seonamhaeicola sp.]|uniref:hypothetical protein n=1 Tax=Seonamhaeicola sp. TaxID=1912245 RepID=UPI00260B3929|nr:hypothetical protein [Seonamhaeicola sp.]
MKKIVSFCYLLITIIILNLGCSSNNGEPDVDDNTPDLSAYKTVKVDVILPEGMNIDLTSTTLSTLLLDAPVNSGGSAEVPFNTESPEIAYLSDANDNILLLGFIRGSKDEISIATTAEVLYYVSLGTMFLPYELKQRFIAEIESFEGTQQLSEQLAGLAKQDPLFLQKGLYRDQLVDNIRNATKMDTVDIRSKRIDVNGADIRSGLQLKDIDFQNITITNTLRRRAHAFVYKTAYKNNEGKETIIDDNISGTDVPMADTKITQTTAIREVLGVLADWAAGKGAEFAETVSDPITLPLQENESEATYKVRVIGPSDENIDEKAFTTVEKEKLYNLHLETFIFDWFLPVITDLGGHKKLVRDLSGQKVENILDFLGPAISSISSVYEPIKKGQYNVALDEFILSLYNNATGSNLEEILIGLFTILGEKLDSDTFMQNTGFIGNGIKKTAKALEIVDFGLKLVDYGRMIFENSKELEEWTAKAKASDILLSPNEKNVLPYQFTDFEVLKEPVPDEGAVLQYQWSTSGKYGTIRDNHLHEGTSFQSIKDKISYIAKVPSRQLSDGPNIEEIYVSVSIKKGSEITQIGKDTARVNVRKFGYKIRPNGITMQGGTNLTLHIDRTDNQPLVDDDVFESKVIWTTSGRFGQFNGNKKQLTLERTGGYSVNYEALDKIHDGEEDFVARIYRKERTDTDWLLWDVARATLKIDNDRKKKIQFIKIKAEIAINKFEDPYYLFSVQNYYRAVPVEGAVSYEAKIIDQVPDFNPTVIGETIRWEPGGPKEPRIVKDSLDIFRRVFIGRQSGSPIDEAWKDEQLKNAKKVKGTVQVTAFLE